MAGTIIGAIVGAFIGWIIIAALTDGPKYPGDTAYGGGPGCFVSLIVVIVLAAIGAAAGAFLG